MRLCSTGLRGGETVLNEFRKQAELLTPRQIRGYREDLDLTQKEFAAALDISETTVSRWENGVQIQQKCLDNLMRIFFWNLEVRQVMMEKRLPTFGCQGAARTAT